MFRAFFILALVSTFATAQTRIIPHLTRPGGDFTTTLIMVNNTDTSQDYRLTPYDQDGNPLGAVPGTLASGETMQTDAATLFPAGDASHFMVDGNIHITTAYQDAGGSNSAAHVGASDTQAHRWRLYPGELDDVLDGIAVVNMDAETRDIHVRQVNLNDQELSRATPLTLMPNSKGLYVFSDFTKTPGTFFEIFADGPLALTALRFATGGEGFRFFWSSDTVPMPALVEDMGDPRIGKVAVFPVSNRYGISGQAVIVDERTIRMEMIHYNGEGPDVRVYLGQDRVFANGRPVTDKLGVLSDDTFDITLPDDYTLDDFNSISIWCTLFSVDFSSAYFE